MASIGLFREHPIGTVLRGLIPAKIAGCSQGVVFYACAITLICSLLLGGGTHGGFLSDAILEFLAIPALLISLSSLIDRPAWKTIVKTDTLWALALCFTVPLVPILQLVPLPPAIWTRLPGREEMMKVFDLVGHMPWMPISVSPHATWLSFLSLLAPIAIFLGTIQLDYAERRLLSLVAVAIGVGSAFLGLMQFAQGPASTLRFFSVTNSADAVGFFANRNHFAALLYTTLLFAAAWAVDISFRTGSWLELKRLKPTAIVPLTASFMVLVVLIAVAAMTRSRAGLGLTIVALAGAFALMFSDRRTASGVTPSKLLSGAVLLTVILVVQFALYRILGRFAADPVDDARVTFAHDTIRAAMSFMPFGAGVGTFVPVYGMFEAPTDTLAYFYVNHAHNDFLEIWLETGIIGLGLIGIFITWLARRFIKIWRHALAGAHELDHAIMRAALIAISLLMVHSLVDYPLRTGAMMAIFALSCALLIEPLRSAGNATNSASAERRVTLQRQAQQVTASAHLSARTERDFPGDQRGAPAVERKHGGQWGEDIDWPEAWKSAETGKKPNPDRLADLDVEEPQRTK